MEIKGILISALAPFENHIANGGEKLLGNASSIKRRPDGRVYVSGQMQRHVLFSAIDRLNMADAERGETFVSTGDGTTNQIETDLRADLGGFMHPSKGDYSGRRTAPLSVTPAVAKKESEVKNDLLVRVKNDSSDQSKEQALATKEFSQSDLMNMNFFLDVTSLSVSKVFSYHEGFNIGTRYIKHATDVERVRRAKLYIEATRYMNDYANQARNAVCGEPQQVIIVFDTVLSRKACRYFVAEDVEKKNILAELDDRGAKYFIGDDKTENTVAMAYKGALKFLAENELSNPAGDDSSVQTFAQAFGTTQN
ncbi:MAG: type I-PGING CRISPR-associated protein Cas7/Csp1 [Paludibacteraceae bacterium]|nr:type I-PGING CRISPR-associated protein Cas7/Csp1 [Paludibacteraceae bacterium]